jgi:hypothetical protein
MKTKERVKKPAFNNSDGPLLAAKKRSQLLDSWTAQLLDFQEQTGNVDETKDDTDAGAAIAAAPTRLSCECRQFGAGQWISLL